MSAYTKRFGFHKGDFPNTEKHFERIISLPLYPSMTEEEADYVISAVRDIVEKYHK
jgi:dTDP-4-amino-4,6-dideoxygalactose transaminase